MTRTVAAFGSWVSPLSAELLVQDVIHLDYVLVEGDDTYWLEVRPLEEGRYVLVHRDAAGRTRDLFGPEFSSRTLVHEYGGLNFAVHHGTVFFSNLADQRIYRIDAGGEPVAITPAPPSPRSWRYADLRVSPDGARVVGVRERHEDDVVNDLVVIDAHGATPMRVLARGHDFFAAPTWSPDGHRVAWTCWDHPNMPWDHTSLVEAVLDDDGYEVGRRLVAGDDESLQQPRYDAQGRLTFISDRSGWWNLYRDAPGGAVALYPLDAEFGGPAWHFGDSSYQPLSDGSLLATWRDAEGTHAGVLRDEGMRPLTLDWPGVTLVQSDGRRVVGIAHSPRAAPAVVEIDPESGSCTTLVESFVNHVDAGYLSVPRDIEFPTERGLSAHAYYYPPTNADFAGPPGHAPPLIVASHGGPTAQASDALNYAVQYWTSRGFAVVDVNYGGSTGYGREYRNRLRGQWGVVDLDDCVNAATYLVSQGLADPDALLIHGGSAGGYTTLCALTFRDTFAAGASYFGISDLATMTTGTHKFESRYLDSMIGRWPEDRDVYESRSAYFHRDLLSTPMILFQGLEDEVVPPEQAAAMVEVLQSKAIPHVYVAYEGEQHGFRRAANIIRSAEAELYFYSKVLSITLPDDISPVSIAFEERLPQRDPSRGRGAAH
ncbi:MAG: S9 family peptidase [Acidobacteria bacterium]|nr:S9 family peptidase [Acidobacteriota bacterium]